MASAGPAQFAASPLRGIVFHGCHCRDTDVALSNKICLLSDEMLYFFIANKEHDDYLPYLQICRNLVETIFFFQW